MTQNNYPEGLDELAISAASSCDLFGTKQPPDVAAKRNARALLDALAERGHVLVDAKKQEPVVKVSDVMMVFRLMQSGKLTPNTEDGWAASMEAFTVPAIPGRVDLPDGWKWVPVEPTMAMLDAAHSNFRKDTEIDPLLKTSYRAMLSAAPTPPTQPQGDGSSK